MSFMVDLLPVGIAGMRQEGNDKKQLEKKFKYDILS